MRGDSGRGNAGLRFPPHRMGEAFRGTIRSQELHRLVVEGAVRILDADGGAL